jgi:hypothetical protein
MVDGTGPEIDCQRTCLTRQVMRRHPAILCVALAAALSACAKPTSVTPSRSGQDHPLVQDLADANSRDAAYCGILRLRLFHRPADAYTDTCGPVTEVVTAPQPAGSPLFIMFTKPVFEIEREPIRRGPAGTFTIVDRNGYMVPVFSGANVVHYESEVFAYSPQGHIAIGHVFGMSSRGSSFDAGSWSVQTLHIVPTAVSQQPALSVAIGAPTFGFDDDCAGNFWSWRYRDVDADGWPEIEIGPRTDAEGHIIPMATFRWSNTDHKYVGPSGSIADQFIQFRPRDRSAFDAYAGAWRSMQEKRTGYRLSWCRSESTTVTVR